MFGIRPLDSSGSSTIRSGTDYTATVGLLIVALLFTPGMLVFQYPFSNKFLFFCVALTGLCLFIALQTWKRTSRQSVPSISADRRPDSD